MHSKNESVFFPGGLILVLAIVGLAGAGGALLSRRLRIGLGLGILVVSILALGMGLTGAGYPYRLVYDFAPGWNGVRVPGRIFTLATLFYALLAGAGRAARASWRARWGERRQLRAAAPLAGVVLALAIVGEGAGHLGHPVVPQPAKAEVGLPGPLLDLPTDGAADRVWQYFSTNGFYEIPVGNSTFDFPAVDDLRGGMSGFPDKASIEKLRYYGIRTVVLHLKMPKLPGIVGYATRRAAGSGRRRRQTGRRPRRDPRTRRLARDLPHRPRPGGPARNRLMGTVEPGDTLAARVRAERASPARAGPSAPAWRCADAPGARGDRCSWAPPSRPSSRASPGTRPPTTT